MRIVGVGFNAMRTSTFYAELGFTLYASGGYEGHSLAMHNRIASALNRRVEIRFLLLRSAKGAHALA